MVRAPLGLFLSLAVYRFHRWMISVLPTVEGTLAPGSIWPLEILMVSYSYCIVSLHVRAVGTTPGVTEIYLAGVQKPCSYYVLTTKIAYACTESCAFLASDFVHFVYLNSHRSINGVP